MLELGGSGQKAKKALLAAVFDAVIYLQPHQVVDCIAASSCSTSGSLAES